MLPQVFDKPIDWFVGIPVFLLVLMSAVFLHELGHFILAKLAGVKVEEFAIGFPPRLFAFKKGETVYAINLLPLGGYCRMLGEEDPAEPRSLARAPKRWRAAILLAGVTMNMLFAITLFTVAFMTGDPSPTGQVSISSVLPNSAATGAHLQAGDIIEKFNNTPINSPDELIAAVAASQGKPSQLLIKRGDSEQVITVTPQYNDDEKRYLIGFVPQLKIEKIEPTPHPIGEAFELGLQRTWEVIYFTVDTPRRLLQGQLTPAEARPVGLPGIAQMTADAATYSVNTGWWWPVLSLAGLLNVGLALANVLPLPALDGGRLVFVLIEALRGRRISPEKEGLVHLIGFGVLLTLMIVVMAIDVTSPLPRIWGSP